MRGIAVENLPAGGAGRQCAAATGEIKNSLARAVAAVLGSFAWQWRDVQAIRNSTPVSNRMAYGALAMKAQLEEEWGAREPSRLMWAGTSGWPVGWPGQGP